MAKPPTTPGAELTIGELASLTRLTVRALRHYDHIGLLQPARVDPTNGYRYYDTGQIVSASTIAVLRSLDIDVETIGHLLDGSRRLDDVVAEERARRERDARRAAASLAVLAALDPGQRRETPQIHSYPTTTYLGTTIEVSAANDIEVAAATFTELFSRATAAELPFDPDGVCIVRSSTREEMRLDVCIRPTASDRPTLDGYRPIVVEGGPTASVIHTGPLASLPLAHARLHSWILEHGAEANGDPRETYLGDLADHRTRLDIPVSPGFALLGSAPQGRPERDD